MTYQNTEDKLRELARYIAEPTPPRLSEKIRRNIPPHLPQGSSKDAVNIFIHLRISRLAAVAVILLTLVLCWYLFGGHEGGDNSLAADLRQLIKLRSKTGDDLQAFEGFYKKLAEDGYEAVFFGGIAKPDNPTDILLYYRLDDNRYRVIFADTRPPVVVGGEELIRIQARMIKNHLKP